jgi:hypothetical protein
MSVDVRGQMVTCKECGKGYRCTPQQDYYNATTLDDGLCETCLLVGMATACPMGCGRTTEDVYGGPCKACWDAV